MRNILSLFCLMLLSLGSFAQLSTTVTIDEVIPPNCNRSTLAKEIVTLYCDGVQVETFEAIYNSYGSLINTSESDYVKTNTNPQSEFYQFEVSAGFCDGIITAEYQNCWRCLGYANTICSNKVDCDSLTFEPDADFCLAVVACIPDSAYVDTNTQTTAESTDGSVTITITTNAEGESNFDLSVDTTDLFNFLNSPNGTIEVDTIVNADGTLTFNIDVGHPQVVILNDSTWVFIDPFDNSNDTLTLNPDDDSYTEIATNTGTDVFNQDWNVGDNLLILDGGDTICIADKTVNVYDVISSDSSINVSSSTTIVGDSTVTIFDIGVNHNFIAAINDTSFVFYDNVTGSNDTVIIPANTDSDAYISSTTGTDIYGNDFSAGDQLIELDNGDIICVPTKTAMQDSTWKVPTADGDTIWYHQNVKGTINSVCIPQKKCIPEDVKISWFKDENLADTIIVDLIGCDSIIASDTAYCFNIDLPDPPVVDGSFTKLTTNNNFDIDITTNDDVCPAGWVRSYAFCSDAVNVTGLDLSNPMSITGTVSDTGYIYTKLVCDSSGIKIESNCATDTICGIPPVACNILVQDRGSVVCSNTGDWTWEVFVRDFSNGTTWSDNVGNTGMTYFQTYNPVIDFAGQDTFVLLIQDDVNICPRELVLVNPCPSNACSDTLVVAYDSNFTQDQIDSTVLANKLDCGVGTYIYLIEDPDTTFFTDFKSGFAIMTCDNIETDTTEGWVAAVFDIRQVDTSALQSAHIPDTNPSQDNYLGSIDGGSEKIIHPEGWTLEEIGKVFATILDSQDGDIYFGASNIYRYFCSAPCYTPNLAPQGSTSIFVDNASSLGNPTMIIGTVPNGTPVVGTSNLPGSAPADLNASQANSAAGVGIGDLALDEENNILYASVPEVGGIYAIDLSTNIVVDEYYPFGEANDGTVAFYGNRAWGLGYNPKTKRLYFGNQADESNGMLGDGGNATVHSINVSTSGMFGVNQILHWSVNDGASSINTQMPLIADIKFNQDYTKVLVTSRSVTHHSSQFLLDTNGGLGTFGLDSRVYISYSSTNGYQGGGDFGQTNYNNITQLDNAVLGTGNQINTDSVTLNSYGFQIRNINGPLNQRADFANDSTWVVDIVTNNTLATKGSIGDVKVFPAFFEIMGDSTLYVLDDCCTPVLASTMRIGLGSSIVATRYVQFEDAVLLNEKTVIQKGEFVRIQAVKVEEMQKLAKSSKIDLQAPTTNDMINILSNRGLSVIVKTSEPVKVKSISESKKQ